MSVTHQVESSAAGACWSCGAPNAIHVCEACGKVQPPRPADYFSCFGLPRKLDLDLARLERDFYHLSRRLHPDLYARAQRQEQQWSLERSSLLNDAYRTLKDPVERTAYLLRLEGIHLEEQSRSATDHARQTGEQKQQVVPPEMLEEVFELNMQLEEARMSAKTGEVDARLRQELAQKKQDFEARLQQLGEELKSAWKQWDALVESEQPAADVERKHALEQMVQVLNRRSYIRNLVRDVNEALER